jgi:ABC-type uncharacterized transport system auxiliary subunit
VPSELRIDAKYVIHGVVRRLEQTANPDGGVIEVELALLEKDSDRLIASKVFHVDQTAGGNIDAAVGALNAGMNQIFHDFVILINQTK